MQPTNNKSLFHAMCALMEKIEQKQITNAQADLMIKAAGRAHECMLIELKRARILHEIGQSSKIREVETILIDQ